MASPIVSSADLTAARRIIAALGPERTFEICKEVWNTSFLMFICEEGVYAMKAPVVGLVRTAAERIVEWVPVWRAYRKVHQYVFGQDPGGFWTRAFPNHAEDSRSWALCTTAAFGNLLPSFYTSRVGGNMGFDAPTFIPETEE